MHEILVNGLGGLSLPRKSVVRLSDHPDMTLDVYRGRKTTTQHKPIVSKTTAIFFLQKKKKELLPCKGSFIFSAKKYVLDLCMP